MATPDIETIAQDLAIGVEALLVKVRDQHQEILKWRKKFQSQEGEASLILICRSVVTLLLMRNKISSRSQTALQR